MKPFTTHKGKAAPVRIINIDTDMIIPKQFLKTTAKEGLGAYMLYDLRFNDIGEQKKDFVLNTPQFANSTILLAYDNFGCGSSREHAPWAITDYGVRAVIAPSFADIFFNNSGKNGLLLVKLPKESIDALMKDSEAGYEVEISLPEQTVSTAAGTKFKFEIDSLLKEKLLNGLDDIGITMQKKSKIEEFEAKQKEATPWL
ncbi:3-isopropylmalate/(R)-2-methylmalate dehydratase small subunit [Elusimicrobium posterum]|uniref:3-isopropylmalate dehydratase small subunit n=1 Tax=Elusimicrobium posterum TaxID=3116653 RepID=UPI003C7703DD